MQAVKSQAPLNPVCGTTVHGSGPAYSGFWAGYQAPNADYGYTNFTWASSDWYQPSVPSDSHYTDYQSAPDASFWVGIGNSDLIQAGADSISTATPQYRFWTEDAPEPTVWEGPVIRPNQETYVYVQYDGDQKAYYFLENETTGSYDPFTNPAPDVGSCCGDFINERIQGYYLPQYTTSGLDYGVEVTDDSFGNSSSTYSPTVSKSYRFIMTSNCVSNGLVLSEPSSLDSYGDFNHEWYASSPYKDGC